MKNFICLLVLCVLCSTAFAGSYTFDDRYWSGVYRTQDTAAALSEYESVLTLDLKYEIKDLRVIFTPRNGQEILRSIPAGERDGEDYVVKFDKFTTMGSHKIRIWCKASDEGIFPLCAVIEGGRVICGTTAVSKPKMKIKKSGTERVDINGDINYTVVVVNEGSTLAKDVVIVDSIPEGLKHPKGYKSLKYKKFNLAPGESKTIRTTYKAIRKGTWPSTVTATSSNAGTVSDNHTTIVIEPGLNISVNCDKKAFIGSRARATVSITNNGDTDHDKVTLAIAVSDSVRIVTVNGSSRHASSRKFNIGSLAVGETKQLVFEYISDKAVKTYFIGKAGASGVKTKQEVCWTEWEGISAVMLEVKDEDHDPVAIGRDILYTIYVKNQGSKDDKNLVIKAKFDPSMVQYISSSATATRSGGTITFATIPVLKAGNSVRYVVKFRALRKGQHPLYVEIKSSHLDQIVFERETTTLFKTE